MRTKAGFSFIMINAKYKIYWTDVAHVRRVGIPAELIAPKDWRAQTALAEEEYRRGVDYLFFCKPRLIRSRYFLVHIDGLIRSKAHPDILTSTFGADWGYHYAKLKYPGNVKDLPKTYSSFEYVLHAGIHMRDHNRRIIPVECFKTFTELLLEVYVFGERYFTLNEI